MAAKVDRVASSLYQEIGSFKEQQVVSILLPNSWQFVVAYLAILKLGHIAHPLDPAYKKMEIDAILDQIPSLLTITDQTYQTQIGHHPQPTVLIDNLSGKARQPIQLLRFDPAKQIASLTFTSGTTGQPKAVPNTHANHIWNIEACSQVWDWTADDTLLVSVPLSHMLGIVMALSGVLYHGNTMYLQRWFDEKATLEALASGKISFFTHAASAYVKLLEVGGKYDLSKVRLCVSGGAPLPPAVWQEFKDRYGIEILETYGTSETGRIAGNQLNERVLGSPGRPLPGVNLRLNENDEVEVKSPGVFPGYHQNKAATLASLSDDGFWRTGDIGEIKDGYVFLKGRVQERIRRFGYTISPRDVEWALHQNPKIKDIYVMGYQHPRGTEDELIYFVVGNISEDELNDYCKQNLIYVWRPDRTIFLDDLPRTRSGKPRINKLREMVV